MKLTHLIDLETQLARDEKASRADGDAALRERDRAIGKDVLASLALDSGDAWRRFDDDLPLRRQLALGWLARVRDAVPALPGPRWERGLGIVGLVLGFAALLAGAGAAKAALAYDGTTPVNVFWFLVIFVAFQVVLLIGMILLASFRRAIGRAAAFGWCQGFVAWLGRRFGSLSPEAGARLATAGSRQRLYAGALGWRLFTLTQWLGVVFNASALVVCLYLIAFTDLVFSWSTTLDLEAGEVKSLLDAIALPWSWLLPDPVPSAQVIADSEWIRHGGGAFRAGVEAFDQLKDTAGAWWRFLVAALACYGLLPRLVTLCVGLRRTTRELRRATLDHAGYLRLFERLLPEGTAWRHPPADEVGAAGAARPRGTAPRPPRGGPVRLGVIAWGSLSPQAGALGALAAQRHHSAAAVTATAGGADLAADEKAIAACKAAAVTRVVFAVGVGVQPTKEIFDFLARLRRALDDRAHILIALVRADGDAWAGPDPAQREAWDLRSAQAGDPYLSVDGLVPS